MKVLLARVGKERLYTEAVDSHIGGWFRNAAVSNHIGPVAQPEYDYELPESGDETSRFTATVDVQPKPEVADWTTLEVPRAEPDVPRGDGGIGVRVAARHRRHAHPRRGPAGARGRHASSSTRPDGEGERDDVVEPASRGRSGRSRPFARYVRLARRRCCLC